MRKFLFLLASILLGNYCVFAQTNTFPTTGSAGIGTNAPKPSALLDVQSSTKGVLIPRMTQIQRDAIVNPANGLLIFQTNNAKGFYYFNGTAWVSISNGSASNRLSNLLANTAVNVSLLPVTDDSINIGSNELRWRNGFFADTVNIGNALPTSRLNVAGKVKIADGTQAAGKVLTSDANGLSSWLAIPTMAETDPEVAVTDTSAVPRWNGAALVNGIIKDNGTNVGIGTAFPLAKLDVNGNVKIVDGTQGTGKVLTSDANGLSSWQAVPAPVETDPKVTNTTTNKVAKWNGTALTDGLITDDGTNIGIGTATPTAKLDVTGNIKIANGTQGEGKVLTSDANGLSSWQVVPPPTEIDPKVGNLSVNKTPKWNGINLANGSITDNGNVGIGEANPQGILHVSQPFIFAGVNFAGTGLNDLTANIGGYTGTATTTYIIKINNAGPVPNLIQVSSDGGSSFGSAIPIANPVILANGVTASFSATGGHTFGDQWTWSVGKSFNNVLFAESGRVGINTITPIATLEVAGGDARINGLTLGRGRGNDTTNTAIGFKALDNSDLFSFRANNTAIGYEALAANTAGSLNTAVGSQALRSNTSGASNTATGYEALDGNTTGGNNTAIGRQALHLNTTASENTAIGAGSLYVNTTGNSNTALGRQSLFNNTSGASNTATGAFALISNTRGFSNTAVGQDALFNNTTGNRNSAFGDSALANCRTGSDNTAIGAKSNPNVNGSSNTTALGANTAITGPDQVRLGASTVISIGGQVGYTTLSDGRFKTKVEDNVPGIEFISKLRPVTYHLDVTGIDKFTNINYTTSEQLKARNEKEQITYTGFIAQEVEAAAKSLNFNFSGVDAPKNDKDMYGLRYAEFVVPLVKAVQELSKKNEELTIDNGQLKAKATELDAVKKEASNTKADLQKQIDDLKALMQQLLNNKSIAPCPPLAGK